jgi:hypothetical protein
VSDGVALAKLAAITRRPESLLAILLNLASEPTTRRTHILAAAIMRCGMLPRGIDPWGSIEFIAGFKLNSVKPVRSAKAVSLRDCIFGNPPTADAMAA